MLVKPHKLTLNALMYLFWAPIE